MKKAVSFVCAMSINRAQNKIIGVNNPSTARDGDITRRTKEAN